VGCYAQLKPEELAAVDGVISSWSYRKFKLPIISMIYLKMIGEVHSCEIADADFMWEVILLVRTRAFKSQDGCDYKCTHCTIPLARGISRSDEMEMCCKMPKYRSNIKEIVLTGVIEIMEKENLEIKTRTYFLELVQELDKVEG
jgi:threonylcarbamoyladenosine tRNA methylthiotransferase MtaB